MKVLSLAATGFLLACSSAPAYYHFIHYTNRSAPFIAAPEKFDLNALPNKTVSFLVSDLGPAQFAGSDSFPSVLAQIRQAAEAWNSVETSDLRVAFGGLFTAGTTQATPAGEVVFEELPPGVLGYGGPAARLDAVNRETGPFVPIAKAIIRLNRDLTVRPGPSFSEGFFLTVVHEMGHALGLQHTMTSSVMSTDVTRATTRTKPLDTDDIAAISLLYPTRSFAATTGTIAGRVNSEGLGLHLASVVALRTGYGAVSTLTAPDGSYRLEGLIPGQYLLYVQALPPARQPGLGPADIVLPLDPDGQPVQASQPFETVFFPGTRDPQQAFPIPVTAGATTADIGFSVAPRDAVAVQRVSTFSFLDQVTIRPAFLNANSGTGLLVASGVGLVQNGAPAPGLGVRVLGGAAVVRPGGVRPYQFAPSFLAVDLEFGLFGSGPSHLLFSLAQDLYVHPSGLHVVRRPPPAIASVTPSLSPNGARTVVLTGTGLDSDSTVYFDSLPATILSRNEAAERIVVAPPPGVPGQRAAITVFNPDGQNSAFVQPLESAPSYTYEDGAAPFATIAPAALPAGAESMIEITGANMAFIAGRTLLGFGSSDVTVQRLWVISPTRAIANVRVSPNATPGSVNLTVINGFQVFSQAFGFQIQPADPRAPVLNSQLAAADGQGIYAGTQVLLSGANLLNESGRAPAITVNGRPAGISAAAPSQIAFQIPPGLPSGPVILRLTYGDVSYAVVLALQPAPLLISAVSNAGGAVGGLRPTRAGERLDIMVGGLSESEAAAFTGMRVTIGGAEHTVASVVPTPGQPFTYQVRIQLEPVLPFGSAIPLIVRLDGRLSLPFVIPVAGAAA
ncbi:MAG: IPT/TIG domain-containing protein [Bryobacteraceae bacterium]